MHKSSMSMMRTLVEKHCVGCATVLDYGSYNVNGTYRDLFGEQWTYRGCDIIEGRNVDIVMPGEYEIPCQDGEYDVVISGSTLEHVRNPFNAITEIARVAHKIVIVSAPREWPEHKYPLDCWRFLPDGMQSLSDHAGLISDSVFVNQQDCWLVAHKAE